MKCSRCRKLIEGSEINFAQGDFMAKPLYRKCKAKVEKESRDKYRKGRAKEYPGDPYEKDVY